MGLGDLLEGVDVVDEALNRAVSLNNLIERELAELGDVIRLRRAGRCGAEGIDAARSAGEPGLCRRVREVDSVRLEQRFGERPARQARLRDRAARYALASCEIGLRDRLPATRGLPRRLTAAPVLAHSVDSTQQKTV